MTTTDWFFPPTQGGQEYGINDAGIAWFADGEYASFAREVIQNSLDAADSSGKPVRVIFRLLSLSRSVLPQVDALGRVIAACRDYTKDICKNEREYGENGKSQFDHALEIMAAETIPVLLVRDENTTGLEGGDLDKNSAWDRLIRQQGAPSMHGAGGGSYGIGQRAPFTVSGLRTIFYGTRTGTGASFIGKAIWRSFRDPGGDMCQHIGFWGKASDKGVLALTQASAIPEVFRRESIGCDLFITGFQAEPGWSGLILDAILENFFAAVVANRLIVVIDRGDGHKPIELSDASISSLVDQRLAFATAAATTKADHEQLRRGLGRTRFWLEALRSPVGGKPFEVEHKKLGKIHLYVTRHADAPCRVAFMRKPRTLVFDQSNRALAGYAAVFLCESDRGNEVLRTFELPDHRSWTKKAPGRDAVMKDVYAFVRRQLEKLAVEESSAAQDLPDLGRYLPEDEPDVGHQTGGLNQSGKGVGHPETGKLEQPDGPAPTRVRRRVIRKPLSAERAQDQVDEEEEGTEASTSSGGEDLGSHGEGAGGGTGGPHGGESGTGAGKNDGPVAGPAGPGTRYPALRPADITFRGYYSESDRGVRVFLRSSRRGAADLVLSAAGEDTSYPIRIGAVEEITPAGAIAVVADGNRLRNVRFQKNERREFLLRPIPDRRFVISLQVENAR